MEKIEELIDEKINDWDDCLNRHYTGEIQNSDVLIRAALSDMEQLKSSLPKPVEVPEFVAEWIEHVKSLHWRIEDVFSPEASSHSVAPLVEEWLTKENAELIARAWLDGYTVVKEPLYYIELPGWGFMTDNPDNPFVDYKEDAAQSTEKEIKAIDERYWAFAVPVEEEVE